MLNWAMSPHVKRLNMAFVLVDEKLADLSDRLDRQSARRDDRGAAAGRNGARDVHRDASTGAAPIAGLLRLRRRRSSATLTAGISLTDLNVLIQSARESGKRLDAPVFRVAEEAAARAAVPRPARVHRAEMDARHRRRPRGGEGAAARGRGAAQARRARQPADGLSALRPGRHRQVVSRAVRQRRDRRAVRDPQELPIEVRRRDGRQPRARAVGAARDGTGGGRRRRSRRRARQPRAGRRLRHVEPRVRR